MFKCFVVAVLLWLAATCGFAPSHKILATEKIGAKPQLGAKKCKNKLQVYYNAHSYFSYIKLVPSQIDT